MPMYFFHMATRGQRVIYTVGKNLPSLIEAHQHATDLVNKTMKYVDTPHHERWVIEVCSPQDQMLLAVMFPAQQNRIDGWMSLTRQSRRQDSMSS